MKFQVHPSSCHNVTVTPSPLDTHKAAREVVAKDVWRDVQVTGMHVLDKDVFGRIRIHSLTIHDAPNGARTVFARSEWGAVVHIWFSDRGDTYPEWVAKCIDTD